jgi:hypothetical protein
VVAASKVHPVPPATAIRAVPDVPQEVTQTPTTPVAPRPQVTAFPLASRQLNRYVVVPVDVLLEIPTVAGCANRADAASATLQIRLMALKTGLLSRGSGPPGRLGPKRQHATLRTVISGFSR